MNGTVEEQRLRKRLMQQKMVQYTNQELTDIGAHLRGSFI
jgi:hypothetical protein